MSRKIKFRAYDKQFKKWISLDDYKKLGAITVENDGTLTLTSAFRFTQNMMICPEAFDVMQFTGLHDKNGKEIYEGDIISNGYEKCIVVWVKEYAGFMLKLINKEYEDKEWTNPMIDLRKDEEVIGNIYDNPELLKGADNI